MTKMPTEMPTQISAKLLQKFCAHESSKRYSLHAPFVIDGWKYAMNGQVAIRIPAPGEPNSDTINHDLRLPKFSAISAVFPPLAEDYKFIPWPAVEACNDCNGTGLVACKECHGSGSHECSCGHEHDCGRCSGGGDAGDPCETCRFDSSVCLSGNRICIHYVHLISQLPQAEFLPAGIKGRGGAVRFRFAGGDGVVMALEDE